MDLALLERGKRGAEEAVKTEMVSAKKLKVEEYVSEIEIDAVELEKEVEADSSCSKPEHLSKVKASGLDGRVGLLLEDKSNALEEDTVEAENKTEVTPKEGDRAVAVAVDELNDDADSCLQGESSLDVDMAAAVEAPASLTEEDPAAPLKKNDEFSNDSEVTAFLDEDVTAANISPTAPSTTKSLDSIQKKDGSRTHEFNSAQETKNDDNVDTAKEAPLDPTEKGPVVAWEKKDELFSDDERPTRVTAESTSSVITKQEDETKEELEELDDESSSSDEDPQTPDTPTQQTSGGKTLFLGNLSFSVEREDVEQLFEAAGGVLNIRFAMNSDETFKGYGYVDFASAEAAEKALRELNGKELLHRRVRLEFVKDRRLFTPYPGQGIESSEKGRKAQGKTIFVRGFDKSGGQDEIRRSLEEHFGSCGEIARVSVPKDQDGSIRGIAFIDFKDSDAFIRALALNGNKFKEGMLSVKEAKSTGDGRDGVGSGRGYGRNDGRYNWQEIGGRSGLSNFRGRSGLSEFRGRCGRSDFSERHGLSDFRERNGWSDHFGRGGQSDIHGRGGWSNVHGIRSDFHGGGGRSDFHGRGGQSNPRGRGGQSDFHASGGWSDFHGRGGSQSDLRAGGGWSDSRGRSSWSDYHIRSGQSDFCSRDGRSEFHWRGDRSDFNGRGDRSDFNRRGDRSDFNRRGDQSNFHGRGNRTNFQERGALTDIHSRGGHTDFHERGDRSNFHGRGDRSNFHVRGDRSNFHVRGDRPDFQGRGGRTDFRPRSFHETGILFGAGIWQRPNGRGAWSNYSRSGISASFNGTNNVGVSGGIGRGQGTLHNPNTAALGAGHENNTTFNNEGKVEEQMN